MFKWLESFFGTSLEQYSNSPVLHVTQKLNGFVSWQLSTLQFETQRVGNDAVTLEQILSQFTESAFESIEFETTNKSKIKMVIL